MGWAADFCKTPGAQRAKVKLNEGESVQRKGSTGSHGKAWPEGSMFSYRVSEFQRQGAGRERRGKEEGGGKEGRGALGRNKLLPGLDDEMLILHVTPSFVCIKYYNNASKAQMTPKQ